MMGTYQRWALQQAHDFAKDEARARTKEAKRLGNMNPECPKCQTKVYLALESRNGNTLFFKCTRAVCGHTFSMTKEV